MPGSQTKTCEFCERELVPIMTRLMGRDVIVGYEICCCDEAQDRARIEREEDAKREEDERQKQLIERYKRSGIPERFMAADVDEEIIDAFGEQNAKGRGLYLCGPVGCGKTYKSMALARQLVENGITVRCTSSMEILSRVRSTFGGDGSEEQIIHELVSPRVLFLDDLGKDSPTEWVMSMLFRIIDERYKRMLPVVITSNYTKNELYSRLKKAADPLTAEALESRLCEMTETIKVGGKDRRM